MVLIFGPYQLSRRDRGMPRFRESDRVRKTCNARFLEMRDANVTYKRREQWKNFKNEAKIGT